MRTPNVSKWSATSQMFQKKMWGPVLDALNTSVVRLLDRSEHWIYRYLGSLQLLASEKTAGSRSIPQSFLPARRGCSRKYVFRSVKYRSIAVLASSTDL